MRRHDAIVEVLTMIQLISFDYHWLSLSIGRVVWNNAQEREVHAQLKRNIDGLRPAIEAAYRLVTQQLDHFDHIHEIAAAIQNIIVEEIARLGHLKATLLAGLFGLSEQPIKDSLAYAMWFADRMIEWATETEDQLQILVPHLTNVTEGLSALSRVLHEQGPAIG